jgi:hypothetical protein
MADACGSNVLAYLDAFFGERRRCSDLDGGVDDLARW